MRPLSVSVDVPPTAQETCDLLSTINSHNGVFIDYDLMLEMMYYYNTKAAHASQRLNSYLNLPSNSNDAAEVLKGIIRSKNLARYFGKTEGGDISLEAKKLKTVLELSVVPEELKALLNLKSESGSYSSAVSQFTKIKLHGQMCKEESYNNHRMMRLEPLWVPQNTGRFAMRSPAIMNISSETKGVITVPKGFVLVAVDSGQIDPNITFSFPMRDEQIKALIRLYGDAYYGILHYCLMDRQYITNKSLTFEKMELTDELVNMRKTLKTNINAVIYNAKTDGGDRIKAALIERVGGHPLHIKWIEETERQLASGNYIFNTAFGTPVDVRLGSNNEGKYKSSTEDQKFQHMVRSAINAKVQGTAADVHRMAIEEEKKYLLYKASDSFIMLSVHDAIYTAVAEDSYDEEIEFLSHVPEYQIDDWTHISASVEIGQHNENELFTHDRY